MRFVLDYLNLKYRAIYLDASNYETVGKKGQKKDIYKFCNIIRSKFEKHLSFPFECLSGAHQCRDLLYLYCLSVCVTGYCNAIRSYCRYI